MLCLSARPILACLLLALALAGAVPHAASAGVDVWTSIGPEGGIFTLISASADGRQVWINSQNGGLFRSSDGGDSWTVMGRGVGVSFSQATLDPRRPGTVWVGAPTGAYRSDDYGLTFKTKNVGLVNPAVFWVAFDPHDANRLLAVTSTRVFVSTDYGETWSSNATGPTAIRGLAVDPAHPGRVWVASNNPASPIWRSDDGGATWATRGNGLPSSFGFSVALDPAHTDRVWAGLLNAGLYRSEDGGGTWTKVGSNLPANTLVGPLAVAPTTPTRLFAYTSKGVWQSDDLGTTLTDTGCPLEAAQRGVVAGGKVFASGIFGVYRRDVAGGAWERLSNGLTGISARTVAVGPDTGVRYLAAFPGIYRDRGQGWEDISTSFPDDGAVWAAAAPGATEDAMMALFNIDGGSLFRTSGNGWASSSQGLGTEAIHFVAIEPARPQVRWVSQQLKVFRSANGGATWTERSSGLPGGAGLMGQILPDPRGNGTVYAVASRTGLYKTTNDGGSWSLVDPDLDFDLGAIGIDPHHPDRVYAGGVNGTVYRSENGGATWTAAGSLGGPVGRLLVDPRAGSDVLYAAAFGAGVFRSTDRGATWTPLAEGLGTTAISDVSLDLRGSTLTLLASTSGSGVFARTVSLGALTAPIDFTSSPTQPREGEAVRFTAVGMPAGAQASWDFGDGSTADGANPEHTFPGPGTYQVTLHVGLGAQAAAKTHAVVVGDGGSPEPCVAGANVLCVRQGRFRVTVDWHDFSGHSGAGTVVTQSSDSGLFWFFSPDNWELMIKVLDGCALNDRYWVFSAATTNVEYTLRVKDTVSGAEKTYHNPSGTAAPAITDTRAFNTCP